MAIITMLFRKMVKNRWLAISMLVGMILCTSLASCIPIYKDAILERMLVKEMEQQYKQSGIYPSSLVAVANPAFHPGNVEKQTAFIAQFDHYWNDMMVKYNQFSFIEYIKIRDTAPLAFRFTDNAAAPNTKHKITLNMRSNIEEHVRLLDGRLPASEFVNGVYEALVTDSTLVQLKTVLGQEIIVDTPPAAEPLRMKIVGVIAEQDLNDIYWNHSNLTRYNGAFFLNEQVFQQQIIEKGMVPVHSLAWFGAVDYYALSSKKTADFTSMKQDMESYYKSKYASAYVQQPAQDILKQYSSYETRLNALLWMLNIPLYVLIIFYMYMVSTLLIDMQKSEIALLRSRGASRLAITMLYAVEFLLLASVAFIAGPMLGKMFTAVLGSSDSFLGFVQRTALNTKISLESYIYALIAALGAVIIHLLPVIFATRFSIVEEKRNNARQERKPFWERFGLDFLIIAVSLYGLYSYRNKLRELAELGLDSQALASDPLLFVVPSLFILGAGLLFLRLYPLLIKGLYLLGKSIWSPALYASFLLVGRRSKHYHMLMIFLILTIGTGIYNASAARTLNQNTEDQIWYRSGSDIVLRQYWINDAGAGGQDSKPGAENANQKVNYKEPDYDVFNFMPGVEQAARVFKQDKVSFSGANGNGMTQLIGIDTYEFGHAAWMKEGLLPYHFNEYLNLIAGNRSAVLVSSSMAEQFELKPGDTLSISYSGSRSIPVTVYGVIPYFPSFNPNPAPVEGGKQTFVPNLIVGHLEMLQDEAGLQPYDVWLSMESSEARIAFYEELEARRIPLESLTDTYEAIYSSRNDPFRMAMNGVLSLSFILSLMVTAIGFLLFWMFSLKARVLQIGVFRAMGISFRSLVSMLGVEQLLTTGSALLLALLSGMLASLLFVPLFQLSFDPSQIVPPFKVVTESGDTWHLLLATFGMLIIVLLILIGMLRRIKVHQAVKLGED